MPRDTVVQIVVAPLTVLRLSDLRLDMRRFKRSQAPGDEHAFYIDRGAGLAYEVYEGKRVALFGHWPMTPPRRGPRALGLDTGCVYGYSLTAYVVETGEFFVYGLGRRA